MCKKKDEYHVIGEESIIKDEIFQGTKTKHVLYGEKSLTNISHRKKFAKKELNKISGKVKYTPRAFSLTIKRNFY